MFEKRFEEHQDIYGGVHLYCIANISVYGWGEKTQKMRWETIKLVSTTKIMVTPFLEIENYDALSDIRELMGKGVEERFLELVREECVTVPTHEDEYDEETEEFRILCFAKKPFVVEQESET